MTKKPTIAIAATFTANLLEDSLAFWMRELNIECDIEFAPFNQVFQQLLDPSSMLSANSNGINIVLVRLEDWQQSSPAENAGTATRSTMDARLDDHLDDLVRALKAATLRAGVPYLVYLCPPSPDRACKTQSPEQLQNFERQLVARLKPLVGVHVIPAFELDQCYPVDRIHNRRGEELAAVPYTAEFFTALGTSISRTFYRIRTKPRKAVVLDCDMTLWDGVCGEVGPTNVVVSEPYKRLQQFMLQQHDAGTLLCLCSKNEQADVHAVFDQHKGMLLTRGHFVAERINWQPKSQNIASMAEELNLGLDSFVVIDDSAIECAEIESNLPAVLTLRLPSDPECIPSALAHMWDLDHLQVTDEDKQRTRLYQQDRDRRQFENDSLDFREFLANLELQVSITPMASQQLSRVAQLVERTNQFNVSIIRRSASEIAELYNSGSLEALVVDVTDRFGDYGLVGAMLFRDSGTVLQVDSFLLSCRALGRGVEHRMLAALGQLAMDRGRATVEVPFVEGDRNQPAGDFLSSVGRQFQVSNGASTLYAFPAQFLLQLEHVPDEGQRPPASLSPRTTSARKQDQHSPATRRTKSARANRIATELNNAAQILEAIRTEKSRRRSNRSDRYAAPRNATEAALAEIWCDVLGFAEIGVEESLFDLGGDSLRAALILSRVYDQLHVRLPLRLLADSTDIAGLAAEIERHISAGKNQVNTNGRKYEISSDPSRRLDSFPLTPLQQAYWVGRTADYNIGGVPSKVFLELECVDLDVVRLSSAWNSLIRRHDGLRLIVLDGSQQRVLDNPAEYKIEAADLRECDGEKIDEYLNQLKAAMLGDSRTSDEWPLFELRASRLSDRRSRLHFCLDMLGIDAASIVILFRELEQLYLDPDRELPPLELSFRDYAEARLKLHTGDLYLQAREYWLNRVAEIPTAPDLPLVKAPEMVKRPVFVRREACLEKDAWQRLKTKARSRNLTPNTVLLAAYADVLGAWSKNSRFTINVPLFNRLPLHPQVEEVVGPFTSVSLLATEHSEAESFEVLARRTQTQMFDDFDHRQFDGVEVMREMSRIGEDHTTSRMPVVFTTLIDHPFNETISLMGDLVRAINQTAHVWMDVQVDEQYGQLFVRWDAVDELFPPDLQADMLSCYARLLRDLADDDAYWQRIDRVRLPEHQACRRGEMNLTERELSDSLLQELFEAQALQQPDEPAVIAAEHTLSYRELQSRAHQVGHWLRAQDARTNTLVAVVMDKGWEQVVGVLGVLASGAAYLPIDPKLPPERIAYLLEHGEVALCLTQSWHQDLLAGIAGLQCLSVDLVEPGDLDNRALEPVQKSTDLAYVIYTSGSTGLPKGVMIDHRGAVNTILDINRRFQVHAGDRVLALSSLSFDLSVYDVFGTLAAGGTVVMPGASSSRDPAQWFKLIERHRVSVWNSVPALMEMLVEYLAGRDASLPASLRLVMLSGDWIPLNLPGQIRELAGEVDVISLGGATEASIWSIYYPIEDVDPSWKSIPYGRPIDNQRFHVLDEGLELCPDWVPGQLYIGGIGLAQGYWRDAEKSAASFFEHPRTGERLYRTGDLGRYLPSGDIEFLGREDFQVKIRGHRIELGEIEAVLKQHPQVKEAVATVIGDGQRDRSLAAYVVPMLDSREPNANEIDVAEHISPAGHDYAESDERLTKPVERLRFKLSQPALRNESRSPSIPLSRPEVTDEVLGWYASRRSYRKYLSSAVPRESLGNLLSVLASIRIPDVPFPKFRYASASGIYPVQTYAYVKPGRVDGIAAGLYYYHSSQHRLNPLRNSAELDEQVFPKNESLFDSSAFALFLIADLSAIAPLYGLAQSRHLCLLEAGLLSQLLETSAVGEQIGLCHAGGVDFPHIRNLFDLQESHEYLHCLLGGPVSASQTTVSGLIDDSRDALEFVEIAAEQGIQRNGHLAPGGRAEVDPASGVLGTDACFTDDVRQFAKDKLPEYMIPASIVVVDSLPLTANGKIDRKALPKPSKTNRPLAAQTRPRTKTEQLLAAIWQKALELDDVGIEDNFFDLGGDSVTAIRLIAKASEAGLKLNPVDVFDHQTIAELAIVADGNKDGAASVAEVTESIAASSIQNSHSRNGSEPGCTTRTAEFDWTDDELDNIRNAIHKASTNDCNANE